MITSIILSYTRTPLQLYCHSKLHYQQLAMMVIVIYGVTIQSRSSAWVWLKIILVIISCTCLSLYFYTISAISPNLSLYLYTCSTLYLLKIFWKTFISCFITNHASRLVFKNDPDLKWPPRSMYYA